MENIQVSHTILNLSLFDPQYYWIATALHGDLLVRGPQQRLKSCTPPPAGLVHLVRPSSSSPPSPRLEQETKTCRTTKEIRLICTSPASGTHAGCLELSSCVSSAKALPAAEFVFYGRSFVICKNVPFCLLGFRTAKSFHAESVACSSGQHLSLYFSFLRFDLRLLESRSSSSCCARACFAFPSPSLPDSKI